MPTISRLLKHIRLFKLIGLKKRLYSAKETNEFKESSAKETHNMEPCTVREDVFIWEFVEMYSYGVPTISRLLKRIRLFCRIQSLL